MSTYQNMLDETLIYEKELIAVIVELKVILTTKEDLETNGIIYLLEKAEVNLKNIRLLISKIRVKAEEEKYERTVLVNNILLLLVLFMLLTLFWLITKSI